MNRFNEVFLRGLNGHLINGLVEVEHYDLVNVKLQNDG